MAENKIKYGLCNVHYAIATIDSVTGEATYGTPVPFPGAVSLSMSPSGENTPFYADNITYYTVSGVTGYEGELEMARVIDSFKTDVLGVVADENDVLVEPLDISVVPFALLFQFEGDQKATRYVFYNCTCGRPNTDGTTKGDSVEPATETLSITATSVYDGELQANIVKAEANGDSDSTVYTNWFQSVYKPDMTP